jgi:phosphoribosylformimino-5-aminoimidazole carboxamide ribotide isomerase
MLHLVDLDGARQGRPVNLEAIGSVAAAVATPLQVAGGVDGPEQIELAFAAGATRVVVPLWVVADDRSRLEACLRVAGDWMAVGLDARPDRLATYPWRRPVPPSLEVIAEELAGAGVARLVLSHGGTDPDPAAILRLVEVHRVEVLVAGGLASLDGLAAVRDGGAAGVILGEALFTGAIDLRSALALAA